MAGLGTHTLYCRLLHGVVVLTAKDQGWLPYPWLFGPLGALTIVLCLPQARGLFRWVLEPRLTLLYRTAGQVAGYQPTSSQPMWPSGSTCRVACATP
ncbi:hypothetical protein ACWEJ6_41850 [Nonomuraea sp. NPDC004702]